MPLEHLQSTSVKYYPIHQRPSMNKSPRLKDKTSDQIDIYEK